MTTLHRNAQTWTAYTKGAPESVLPRCASQWLPDGEAPLQPEALAQAEALAAQGLRVLALARCVHEHLPSPDDTDAVERGMCLIGFIGLIDPPRPEAAAAVRECMAAGIVPVMITGDHPATARAIALRLGLVEDDQAPVLTGADLTALDDETLRIRVQRIRIYAWVDPAQKIRIVEALQAQGEFVAMTGDGVNDAPALKRADIGVAMGKGGTDVAREAASLLLLPIHILWVNLVTDGLPGLALAAEPSEPGIMQRPPRPPKESLFANGMWQHILGVGLLIGGLCLGVQAWAISTGHAHWQTMVLTVLTLSQMVHVLVIRSETVSLWRLGLGSNKPLLGAVLLTFALHMATIYVPALNPIFRTQPLNGPELAICLAAALVVYAVVEVEKAWRRGRMPKGASASDASADTPGSSS